MPEVIFCEKIALIIQFAINLRIIYIIYNIREFIFSEVRFSALYKIKRMPRIVRLFTAIGSRMFKHRPFDIFLL